MINPEYELRRSYTNNLNSSISDGYLIFRFKTPAAYHTGAGLSISGGFHSDFVRHFHINGQGGITTVRLGRRC
jgi:hypothetical protein